MIICVVLSVAIGKFVEAESTTQRPNTTLSTTTQNIKDVCAALSTCGDCVQNTKCAWCESPRKCGAESFFTKECSTKDARRFTCTLSYRTLLIALGVVAGVVLLAVSITCYCCCCRQSKASLKKRLTRDNIQQEREEEERRAKHAARRAERQNKYDEIRQKYGLTREETPYQRFENA